jgi:ribonuclease P protein component
MIKRNLRFYGHNGPSRVYARGYTQHSPSLTLKYIPHTGRKSHRLAVVVSRKTCKSAVVRNRIRRRIYEIVRQLEAQIIAPCDMVFTVYSETLAAMPAKELKELVTTQLSTANLIQKQARSETDHDIVMVKEK